MSASAASSIREKVKQAYSAAAVRPGDQHPFPTGRAFAESLGYPAQLLATLPAIAVDAFAGVSNVSVFSDLSEGATVLDLGCGAGMDSLIAARRVGPSGRVVGVDFSSEMLERAYRAAREAGQENVIYRRASAEELPPNDSEVDVAVVNGIFNLNPSRNLIFRELARVLRPGGSAYVAELILAGALPTNVTQTEADWFA